MRKYLQGAGEKVAHLFAQLLLTLHPYIYSSGIILKGLKKTLNSFSNDSSSKDSPYSRQFPYSFPKFH
jgi:hypothetical protein